MFFYLLDIEQRNDTTVILHGKILEISHQTQNIDASKCSSKAATIRVRNIISPMYYLPRHTCGDSLKEEIINYCNLNKIAYEIEDVVRGNVFYKSLNSKLNLIKVSYDKKVVFSSDNIQESICEFSNPVENIIISRKLKGPCIVQLETYNVVRNMEFSVSSPSYISYYSNSSFPKLKVASIAAKIEREEIARCAVQIDNCTFKFSINSNYSHENDIASSHVTLSTTHSALLSHLSAFVTKQEVDVLVFHNLPGYVIKKIGVSHKITCDIFQFASATIKCKSYSIEEMCKTYNVEYCTQSENSLLGQCLHLANEAKAILQLFNALEALNLSKEMAEISGSLLNRALQNSRAERIEFTFLHELYQFGYLFPPKSIKEEFKYTGGLVLKPELGFYEELILLLDFNSLYPSIIQEFNVCWSTIGLFEDNIDERKYRDMEEYAISQPKGILPRVIYNLVCRRKNVRDLIKKAKNTEEINSLEVRQKALKLTANSIYGCLGYPLSRFCNFAMAAFITHKGRELLVDTKNIAEDQCNMKVIYGDTDSIMIHTGLEGKIDNYNKALEISNKLTAIINRKYKTIEIEIEKVFKKLLLYTKKKYAALCIDSSGKSYVNIKGIDVVRRDICKISSEVLQKVLNLLLVDREEKNNGNPEILKQIYDCLINTSNDLKKLPIDYFVINNVLTKDLSSYASNAALPHLSLANRLRCKGLTFSQNDVISYVIGSGTDPIHLRAYLPSENVELDYGYYISNQLVPSINRLLTPMKNVDMVKINKIFGAKEVIRSNSGKPMTFLTACCDNAQEPAQHCKKCNQSIGNTFYVYKVLEMIRKEAQNLYLYKSSCTECGMSYTSHVLVCANCNTDLLLNSKNEEFDKLIDSLHMSFKNYKIKEIDTILERCVSVSEYRKIDLTLYFAKEIKRYRMVNSL